MANEERLRNLGRLAEWQKTARVLAIKIHGLSQDVRLILDPHGEPEAIDGERLTVLSGSIAEDKLALLDLKNKIKELREELGIP